MSNINPSLYRVWALIDLSRRAVVYAHIDRREVIAFYHSFLAHPKMPYRLQGFRLLESLQRDNYGLVAMEPNLTYAHQLTQEKKR